MQRAGTRQLTTAERSAELAGEREGGSCGGRVPSCRGEDGTAAQPGEPAAGQLAGSCPTRTAS